MKRGAICVQRSGGAIMGPMAEAEVSAKVEMGQKMKAKTNVFVGRVKGINDYGDGLVRVLLVTGEPQRPQRVEWFHIDELEPVA